MAATETRLLLLGAVAIFEPVNGYQIRRELTSWGVEDWANFKPGSVYNGLATLAQRGELTRHDLRDGSREVAVYETTEKGRAEFDRLYERAVTEVRPTQPLAFHTALSMMALMPRERARELLATRLENLEKAAEQSTTKAELDGQVPPHVLAMMDYWEGIEDVERRWLTRLIDEVGNGGLAFLGEPIGWTPAEDDPGQQMKSDRERYLRLLGR